jgi:hypothetical protein
MKPLRIPHATKQASRADRALEAFESAFDCITYSGIHGMFLSSRVFLAVSDRIHTKTAGH